MHEVVEGEFVHESLLDVQFYDNRNFFSYLDKLLDAYSWVFEWKVHDVLGKNAVLKFIFLHVFANECLESLNHKNRLELFYFYIWTTYIEYF
jgi:hypothetical protein